MHILTKIFIVLVSLLAVLLVPLVVVYAINENSFKARYQEAESKAFAAQEALKSSEARSGAETARLQTMIQELQSAKAQVENDLAAITASRRQVESQLALANSTQASIKDDITLIKSTVEAGQQLTESLVGELRTLRADVVAIERQKVELDEALRERTSELEVAEQARRALAEELARLNEEHNKSLTKLGQAIAEGFGTSKDDVRAGVRPDVTLTANIIRVHRENNRVLAEIDAGQRDGIAEGWTMSIAQGGTFIANLRIINVDVNTATGLVTLESKDRGNVKVGHTAHSLAGEE